MIIETKYRDIPFEEIASCSHAAQSGHAGWSRERWDCWRGKPISIITPAADPARAAGFVCGGPFFQVAGYSEYAVCPHIAEIGD